METLYVYSDRLVDATDTGYVRYLYDKIDWQNHLICLRGARGVGKTTLLRQHIKLNGWKSSEALYVSLDHTWFSSHTLLELTEFHYTHGGKYLFLDEVHRYPNWLQEIKNISDYYPSLYVVMTGSSLLKINNSIADLSRRCVIYDLKGLSFREYLKFEEVAEIDTLSLDDIIENHTQISVRLNRTVHLLPYFSQYLKMGYYPFYKQGLAEYHSKIQNVISTVIEVDIPQAEPIEYATLYKAKKLLATLAELVPYTLNVSDLCKTLGVNRNQLLRLLDLLEKSALIRKLYTDESGIQSLAKPEKILFDNTNLMYALSSQVEDGTVRESFFCNQLSMQNRVLMPQQGDVLVDDRLLFEVGGHKKGYRQIAGLTNSYIVADDIESGFRNKIPLYLFGLMY